MKKIDEEGNCTFEYLNYMNSLDKKDLMNFAIGADLLVDRVKNYIDKELFNVNVQENIMLKNELLKIKTMLQGVDKE